MKRWATLACWVLLLCATLFASLPLLLERRPLQDQLVAYVEQSLGVKLLVGSLGWRWLPLPAITAHKLRAESDAFTLQAPEAQLIFNPGILLSALTPFGEREGSTRTTRHPLFAARLFEPDLTIKAHAGRGGTIPIGHLGVVNGRVIIPAEALGAGLPAEATTLTAVNGSLTTSSHLVKIDLRAKSGFSPRFSVKGRLDLLGGGFQAEATAEGLDSSPLLGSPKPGSWLPVVQGLTLHALLTGKSRDRYQLTLTAQDAPFTLALQGQTLQVASIPDLTLTRAGGDFTIAARDLALAAPRLTLTGHVARTVEVDDPGRGPEWSLDIAGRDLDLGAIRGTILALFGQHPVAHEVCTIVGGGEAATARYAFTGRLADFHHLRSMGIWAEAREVPITIPNLGLHLDRASGPIAIIDGQLTGQGLTATIGQSHGENGALLLDLEKERHGFTLDLDLDVDLNDLQDVLSQIIPSPRFQEELSRFVKVRGRAQGHLKLGDDLRQVKTEVEVHAMEAKGVYDRLPWPFAIAGGRLGVGPQHVQWEGVQATLGKQRIHDSQGEVTWKGPLRLDLKGLTADLDLTSLLEEGELYTNRRTLALRDMVGDRFDTLTGRARLHHTTLSGPVLRPEEWQYHTEVKADELTVTAPGVPELRSQEVEGMLSQDRAEFTGVFSLLGQELFLAGRYGHRLLAGWRGELEIDGDIGAGLGEWLREREVIPAATFPRLPFRLEKFTLNQPGVGVDSLLARGVIRALPLERDAALHLSLNRAPDGTNHTLTFVQGARQGILNYQTRSGPGEQTLWSWQGELDFQTLDALVSQRLLQGGRLAGTCSLLAGPGTTTYAGELEAQGVQFGPESPAPGFILHALRLQGKGEALVVQKADLDLAGAPATLSGQVLGKGGRGHQLDLRLTAQKLSWDSLRPLVEEYSKGLGQDQKGDTLRGAIRLDIGALDYTLHPKQQKAGEGAEERGHTLTAAPLTGELTLDGAGLTLRVERSSLCGINGQGTWHFGKGGGEDHLTFTSGPAPLSFAEALPCLGIKQSLIIGPFSVAGEIRGRPKGWRQGSIALTSKEGLIKRMTLLSKIFTAVNFTDLFTWADLPDMEEEGLPYNDLAVNGHIEENRLVLDRTIVKGKGVNLSGRGTIDLADLEADLTFFIAPFKMVDSVISNIPLIGKALAGPKESILTFPVTVTGNLKAPEVTALAPEAVGSATLEMFRDTLTLPFRILLPEETETKTPPGDQPSPRERNAPFP